MTEVLLEAGANPNAVLPEGETVLMTAARTGKAGGGEALLEPAPTSTRARTGTARPR